MSNIKLKALKWEDNGIPVTVDDNYAATLDPNTGDYIRKLRPDSTNPYHWWLTQTPNGDELLGPYPAVYLKGAAPKLTVEVQPLSGTVPVRARLNMDLSTTTPGYPFEICNDDTILGSNKVTITCPALKDEVNIVYASTTWNFQCRFTDGTWSGIYGRNNDAVDGLRLYAVYSTPLTPQSPPWIGVLEDACAWAAGKNTALDVARYTTTGLFFSQRFAYPDSTAAHWLNPFYPEVFRLSDFLNAGGYQSGNCMDVSDYLCICANALGLSFTVAKYQSNPNYLLVSNPVCLIGGDPTAIVTYSSSTWAWHQICHGPGDVYDVCAAQWTDLSGNTFSNPPYAWPLNGYWQTLPGPLGLVNCLVDSQGATVQVASSPSQFASYVPRVY